METETRIQFSFMDVTAKDDAQYTAASAMSFSNPNQLKQEEELKPVKYATLERDQFLLDGSFRLLPDSLYGLPIGVWSQELSDVNGDISTPLTLTIHFQETHSSNGLTLRFAKEEKSYATRVDIGWYDGADAELSSQSFLPDKWEYFAENKVLDYQKLVLRFYKTNKPEHFVKLTGLDFGSKINWNADNLIRATMRENLDPTGAQLSFNTLQLSLHSEDTNFNLYDPKGIYELLQERQALEVNRFCNQTLTDKSTFYLASWQETSQTPALIQAYDLLGFLDAMHFQGGIYNDVTAESLIDQLMAGTKLPYQIEASLKTQTLRGWLPQGNCRDALRNIAFALGATVTCSRNNLIYIAKPTNTVTGTIPTDRQSMAQGIKQSPLVTGVEVLAHSFSKNTEKLETVYQQELPLGIAEISFNKPCADLQINTTSTGTEAPAMANGIILAQGANHCKIEITTPGKLVLQAYPYADDTQVVRVALPTIPAGNKANVVRPKDCTLLDTAKAQNVANRLFNYYANRYESSLELLLEAERVGQLITLANHQPRCLTGQIEALDIDLLAGFLTTATIRGKLNTPQP